LRRACTPAPWPHIGGFGGVIGALSLVGALERSHGSKHDPNRFTRRAPRTPRPRFVHDKHDREPEHHDSATPETPCNEKSDSSTAANRAKLDQRVWGLRWGLPVRTCTDACEPLRTLVSTIQSPTDVYEHPRTVWWVYGMEEVRSSILLSSTPNNAVLASARTAFCDFGGFLCNVAPRPSGQGTPSLIERLSGVLVAVMPLRAGCHRAASPHSLIDRCIADSRLVGSVTRRGRRRCGRCDYEAGSAALTSNTSPAVRRGAGRCAP
jgi:hypothetical protein